MIDLGKASCTNSVTGVPSKEVEFVVLEQNIRNLMRLKKTGIYAPAAQVVTKLDKDGKPISKDTSLNNVKKAISKGFTKLGQRR